MASSPDRVVIIALHLFVLIFLFRTYRFLGGHMSFDVRSAISVASRWKENHRLFPESNS